MPPSWLLQVGALRNGACSGWRRTQTAPPTAWVDRLDVPRLAGRELSNRKIRTRCLAVWEGKRGTKRCSPIPIAGLRGSVAFVRAAAPGVSLDGDEALHDYSAGELQSIEVDARRQPVRSPL